MRKIMRMAGWIICFILAITLGATSAHAQQTSDPGTLSFTIHDDAGNLMPGKLVLLQDGQPVDVSMPYGGGLIATQGATVYTASGEGSIPLEPGRYEIWAGRGLEYSADVHHVTVRSAETASLEATLRREVHTPGFIGADMHVHIEHVEHLEERVISIAGEGLEWAISTEHNQHIDYLPAVEKLGVGRHMLTTVGNEVTTSIGHFNAFPVDPESPPVNHRLTDASELFEQIREGSDKTIIQLNHPRWDGGAYFTYMGLSPASGLTDAPAYSEDFDSYELLNENRGFGWAAEPPNNSYSVREDWYHLLNRGVRKPVFGNSDSHTISNMLVGVPRNYVASPTDDPSEASEDALLQSIREGRVTVSRGLYVEASVNGNGVGDLVPLGGGEAHLRVRVQAPEWIDCSVIEVVANGSIIASLAPTSDAGVRLDTTITLRPERDTWYVVTAEGNAPMRPLVHDAPVPITPLGVTNAIWVDTDGDGRFTSIYDETAAVVEEGRNDPSGLISGLAGDPLRMAFAIGYVMRSDMDGSIELLEKLLPHASSHDRILMYRRIAALDTPEALEVLARVAETAPDVQDRAAAALELAKKGREPYLRKVVEHVRTMDVLETKALDFTWLDRGRAISDWMVVGPFPFSASDGLDEVTEVERRSDPHDVYAGADGAALKWKEARASSSGVVDLGEVVGMHSSANAYARTNFESAASGDVLFLLGSDDGVAMWLNGNEVHRNDAHRSVGIGDDVLVLPVQEGTNTLLLKIENGSGDWGYGLELVDLLNVLEPGQQPSASDN